MVIAKRMAAGSIGTGRAMPRYSFLTLRWVVELASFFSRSSQFWKMKKRMQENSD
jgi:hypothetical protein